MVVSPQSFVSDGAAEAAVTQISTADAHAPNSSRGPRASERFGSGNKRSAGTAGRVVSSRRSPVRHARHVQGDSRVPNWQFRSACTPDGQSGRALPQARPANDGLASSPLSAVDFLQGIDRHLAFGEHPLEPCDLGFQGPQALDVAGLQDSELLAQDVDRLLADLVLARRVGDRTAVGFAQDRNHLFFSESTLSHGLLAKGGSHSLKFSVAVNFRAGH